MNKKIKDSLPETSKIPLDRARLIAERLACETSLALFVKRAWPYFDPQPFEHTWHIDAICSHLESVSRGEIKRLLINIPPGMSKSSLVSVCFPAWVWAQRKVDHLSGPQVQFMFSSYAQNLSERDSLKMRRLIESPWYQKLWGDRFSLVGDQNTKRKYENSKNGYRLATSVDGTATGDGGKCHPKGTRILTDKGYVAIEKICENLKDYKVLSYDFILQRLVYSDIITSFTHEVEEIYEIYTLKGYKVRCTGEHPVYVQGKGFIPAAELRAGDWLHITDRPPSDYKSTLRLLWKRASQVTMRVKEGVKSKFQRFILWDGVQEQPSRSVIPSSLRGMREPKNNTQAKILFDRVLRDSKIKPQEKQSRSFLFRMWKGIREKALSSKMLFRRLCGLFAFQTDDRFQEFQLCGNGLLFEPFLKDETIHPRERWASMFGLCKDRILYYKGGTEKKYTLCSSHGRVHKKQSPTELNNSVQLLSQETSRWQSDRILSISKVSGKPQPVYDIQVARTNNFFAEGVLVHNCLIIDDPSNARDINSLAAIENVLSWWTETMPTRLRDPKNGAKIVIMQRLHERDLSGFILDNNDDGEWVHLCIPMRYEADRHCVTPIWEDPRSVDGELLCPERYDEQELSQLERDLGTYGVSGQLQQRPTPRGGGIIKRDSWQLWPPEDWPTDVEVTFPKFEYIIASVDTAYTSKQENDFSACTVWGVFSLKGIPKIMLIEAWKDRLEFNSLVGKVIETAYKRKIDALLIESKASGLSLIQEISRLCSEGDFSVIPINPGNQDKVARVYSVQPIFEGGVVYAPDRKYSDMVITEFESFPKGKNDDLVDCSTQALIFLRKTGMALLSKESDRLFLEDHAYKPDMVNVSEMYGV